MTSEMIPSYYVWMVFIIPFVGALVAPLTGKTRARDYIAVMFALVSAIFTLLLLVPILEGKTISLYNSLIPTSVPWIPELGINVGMLSDPYTIIISSLVGWISFLVMVYSLDYMKGDQGLTRYWFFMNFFIGSMQLIVLSDNLLTLFIGFEGVGLCSYALIGYYYHDEIENWVGTPGYRVLGEEQAYPPSHAGMKAFLMTRIGDIAMLAGIILLFIYAGTFNYQQLVSSPNWATTLAKNDLLIPAALLIFGGAVGKSAQFPLLEWLPDAMAGPAPVSALIHAATMVNAGVVLVARIGPIFYFALLANPSLIQPFFVTVAWIGAFTAFLAATQATVGFELKKILAYSTASQIGYMMLALGLAGLSTNFAQGLSAGLFQLMSHAVFKAALFLMAGVLIHSAHSKYINEMGGMKDRLKLTFAVFLIAVASLSGIPPLSGFWSKDAVLAVAWNSGQFGLFAVGCLTAGITAFYAFRMLGIVFFGQKSSHLNEIEAAGHGLREARPLSWVPYTVLASGTIVLGILGFFDIEGFLQSAAQTYLGTLSPGAVLSGASVSFNVTSAGITLAFVLAGLLVASQLYFMHRSSAERIIASSGILRGLYTFFENRWYINAVYYKVFVDAPLAAANWTHVHFEWGVLQKVNTGGEALAKTLSAGGGWVDSSVIDRIANRIADIGQEASRAARRIQTGIVENYTLVLILGLLVFLLLFILLTGVYTIL
ncbi:MAG: NADH-quinone oxidoreductase subunit L [Thaumarchaeota archaeon]|nr:NADH-quinone oxidoreductase subunit L [Nitrososphaerota archaeon]